MQDVVTRAEVREAFRNGQTREEYLIERAKREADPMRSRPAYREGVTQMLVDPRLYESLLEIARMSLALIEFTEKGGAGAMKPREFELLARSLKGLPTLLDAEKGAGELVVDLLNLLESLED